MAGPDFTTTGLLASLKRRGMIPSTDEAFSTSDFLALCDEELQSYIIPLLLGVREEFLVKNYDVTVTAGTANYLLPPRAIGRELRAVLLSTNGTDFVPLPRIEPTREHELGSGSGVAGFKFENDSVVLVPGPQGGETLRMKYFIRPNKLVATSAVATISSIDAGRTVITTTASIPSTFTTGLLVDVVHSDPGFSTLAMDLTTTATTSGTTITVTTALPSTVTAGDYVCLAQESPIAQIPVEMMPLLAERVAYKVLEALGNPRAVVQEKTAEKMAQEVLNLLSPRSQGNARPIVPRFGPGKYYAGWTWRGYR